MARQCKSLKAPEQGYPHRDHRSKKNRVPIRQIIDRRKHIAFKTKAMIAEQEAQMHEAELYDQEMFYERLKWRKEVHIYD